MNGADKTPPSDGQFVANLVHFARVLRVSGLPIGTGRILDAVKAVSVCGIADREDFYWVLHAVFVNHPRQRLIFDQAFHAFWRNPRILERAMSMLLPKIRVPQNEDDEREMARRLSESLYPNAGSAAPRRDLEPESELRAALTYSDQERLQTIDFESMTREEMNQAKSAIAKMRAIFKEMPTRRYCADQYGSRLDMRRTLKRSMRNMGEALALERRQRATRQPPVVLLCDISGSMSEYSRMMLHFAHVLTMSKSDVACFVFGTRLTNITRQLRTRDVDYALEDVADLVTDWHGGTRIGDCIEDFNRNWVRRLPVHKAVVLLVSDGLDRSESGSLESGVAMLHRSCRSLIWLNPLLRYEQFEPKVSGIRAILPHVDEFRPVHNLRSLESLSDSLQSLGQRDGIDLQHHRRLWRDRMRRAEMPVEPDSLMGAA